MSVKNKFQAEYSQYLENFKELSYDNRNKRSLCQNTTHQYYNFDKIVKDRSNKSTPASPDTLIFKKNKIYCVEFKNSFFNQISASNIKKKLENGHQVLSAIFKELDLQLKDYQLIFCVVCKGFDENEAEKQRWSEIRRGIESEIRFDLKQYIGVYCDDILTKDIDFFREQFIKKINKNLPC
ncbi:hypothetical protein [uncultured Gammaproteobacteria bacterium]|jgi:hypothetical protein|uniref:Uncharacterized protein n=2 Tax=Bathymodiolus azoricus thioautotrophic gill symbiont TaxID=235205 RepID=A0ACA8ZRB0_9GAMM|nr:hypothetical protein [Bathymodiolus azoricus thioautotrophic gill symbiont]CAC9510252.1 hypothetical protein [uncultured Gammaproteobacteria bacterium]CAB5502116.1 hypothetical protein AZO1586R_1380 [Bathymodiolus azoricus thioautotrophic gill symbiont]CAC9519939.1 hypothetical protein [uncultured Gammaproteobacteria bacterium]CAC9541264.1 hypothetical protein [uncultured Gammaproteobacteria bacterium]SEH98437.1 conserved hypothetical protein [Bathymodiolus azoricus thioautotrophic gill sym